MSPSRLTFWYDFASTYSYLAAMRIESVCERAGVELAWQPFLLGPIFAAQGWTTSPFNLYPAKGAYMVRDIDRMAGERGLPFTMPKSFPANSLQAARIAHVGVREGWIGPFTRAVYTAQFGSGESISDPDVLARALADIGQEAPRVLRLAEDDTNGERLKQSTNVAKTLGIFGAPSFTTEDDELFWGDDRLEQAVAWALRL